VFPVTLVRALKHLTHPSVSDVRPESISYPVRRAAAPVCGTCFSREGAMRHIADLRVRALASSRLKPVPLEKARS
jgi:hypothetical protein